MKTSDLKQIIKEVLMENQPKVAPSRPQPTTIPRPDTKPEPKPKRRTLTPPIEAPTTKPKAEGVIKENEQDVANKIAQRFNKLSK